MDIDKVLVFNIKGKVAHFKKYYSNKSSLTYRIPTRTILMGMIASILKYPRDSYFNIFDPDKAKFGIKINKAGSPHFECMNYLKEGGGRTQVRLQLLLPKKDMLEYKIYFTHNDSELVDKLAEKIKYNKLGYGIFLGQRQFRATVDYENLIDRVESREQYTGELHSLTYKDNIKNLDMQSNMKLTVNNMPVSFEKIEKGRKPLKMKEVCFEENGNKIKGTFNEVVKVNNEYISFYTPIQEGLI
ncbi:MAG: CRISPR-associated protein Cas5 [bacterium]